MASLKDALAPTLLVASAVFAAFATPLVFVGERQVTIRMDRDVVYDGIIRDVSLPYIAFSLVVSMGAGLTTMTVAGWNSSTKRNIALENERETLRAELHEKEIQIDELKLSSANLAAAGLDSFLDAAEAMPQAPEIIAEMLVDDPFITVEPVAAAPAAPAAAPRTVPQPIHLNPEVVPTQPVHAQAPQTVVAQAAEPSPASTHAGATISGEALHVYGALQDRFEQAAVVSHERNTAASRAYTPADSEVAPPTRLAAEMVSVYTALHERLQTVDLPSPAQRSIATSRAYVPEAPLTAQPTHLEAQDPPPQIQAQPEAAHVKPAPTGHPVVGQPSPQSPPAAAPAQPTRPPEPLVVTASPPIKVQPVAQPAVSPIQPAAETRSAADATSQTTAAYAVLGLSESPQVAASPEADLADSASDVLTPAPATVDPAAQDPVAMPWDRWLEASTLPSETAELPVPEALAGLEAWLAPATTSDHVGDGSVLSAWDQWLQQQQAPAKRPQSRNNLEDWLAAFKDDPEAEAGFFEMPLAAPDTHKLKVVHFQRSSGHSRKDS